MMDKIDQTLADITQKMADLSVQHGSDAGVLLLAATRYAGISSLVVGFVLLVLAAAAAWFSAYAWRRGKSSRDPTSGWMIVAVVVGVSVIICGALALLRLLDPWAWTAAIDPSLYLAHEILQNIGR